MNEKRGTKIQKISTYVQNTIVVRFFLSHSRLFITDLLPPKFRTLLFVIQPPSNFCLFPRSRNRYTFLTTSSRDIHFCGAPCDDDALFWTSSDRAKVRISIAIASAFSLLTTAFAIATYCTDASRFRYPEKPIIWLAACYRCRLVEINGHLHHFF